MPRLQRSQLPRRLFRHLRARVLERQIPVGELVTLAAWMDSDPVVPEGRWFKRFDHFIVCGEGTRVKTFLLPGQLPDGAEVG